MNPSKVTLRFEHTTAIFVLQVVYACREQARRAVDVIARRTRLAFLNVPATEEALPRIIEIMAQELKWNKAKQKVKNSLQNSKL